MITYFVNSFFNSICYKFNDIIIDPGDEWEGFNNVSAVLLTHAHFDHIYGLNNLFARNPETMVYTNEHGRSMLLDAKKNLSLYHETPFVFKYPGNIVIVNDGEKIELGDDIITEAMFTPGHNPSCITWIIDNCVFSGDSYIPGIKTVTNLPDSNKTQAEDSIKYIMELAIGRTIYPGHKI